MAKVDYLNFKFWKSQKLKQAIHKKMILKYLITQIKLTPEYNPIFLTRRTENLGLSLFLRKLRGGIKSEELRTRNLGYLLF